jgi:glycosyltransferase involved in cell wall biosynthesis
MRIAWIGPTPAEHGTVTHISAQLIDGLAELGFEIDVYCESEPTDLPDSLRERGGVRFIAEENPWEWNRWYSRTQLTQVVTGAGSRALVQLRLGRRIAAAHSRRPYDLVYQASQLELLGLRPHLNRLPPIVFHPHTHAAGELRWLKRESALAARCASPAHNRAVIAMMAGRAGLQRRHIQHGRLVIALSERFGEHLARDYGYPADRIAVVPNPIDLDRLTPVPEGSNGRPASPLVLFVSRIAVRKGVDSVVRLSHALGRTDAARLMVIGGNSKWSNYRPLLDDLDPRIAQYRGHVPEQELASLFRHASVLVQPSRFEPFGLTVAEALASGVPVVATDEVGATEGIDPAVCRVVPAGDEPAFERAVHDLLSDIGGPKRAAIRRKARAEAERSFSPSLAAERLALALESTKRPAPESRSRARAGSAPARTPGRARVPRPQQSA